MIIDLPWPSSKLKPNGSHGHWAVVANARKKARAEACLIAKAAIGRQMIDGEGMDWLGEDRIPVRITFYPPDRRRRDDDNMVASFKAYRDGIADALGVDDRRFRPHYFFEDAAKPGKVIVSFPACGEKAEKHSTSGAENGVTGGSA